MSLHPLYQANAPPTPTTVPKEASSGSLTFDEIYESWFEEVTRWIRAMGGPTADREDLVQEVFVVVHRRLPDFDGGNLAGWLYRIARSKVRDHRRLNWVKRVVFWDREPPQEFTDECNPLQSLVTHEKEQLLLRLLGELSDTERMALVLFEAEGYSGQKIAEIQGVPLNTVYTRIFKARQRLSKRLLKLESSLPSPGGK